MAREAPPPFRASASPPWALWQHVHYSATRALGLAVDHRYLWEMAKQLEEELGLMSLYFQVPNTEHNVVSSQWVLTKNLWTQGGLVIGWIPRKADTEMKTGQQQVYWDVLGTHAGESAGAVGLGRRRIWTARQSPQGVLELISDLYTPVSAGRLAQATHSASGWGRVLQHWTGDLQPQKPQGGLAFREQKEMY